MKFSININKLFFTFFSLFIFSNYINAQINQLSPHTTISKAIVSYKKNTQQLNSNTPQVNASVSFTLVNNSNVSKIYFTQMNAISKAVIYQVEYEVNTSTLTNNGIVIYQNNNGSITISNQNPLPLDIYEYKIITETNQGNKSTPYFIKG